MGCGVDSPLPSCLLVSFVHRTPFPTRGFTTTRRARSVRFRTGVVRGVKKKAKKAKKKKKKHSVELRRRVVRGARSRGPCGLGIDVVVQIVSSDGAIEVGRSVALIHAHVSASSKAFNWRQLEGTGDKKKYSVYMFFYFTRGQGLKKKK